jgi:predicted amidohydrolase
VSHQYVLILGEIKRILPIMAMVKVAIVQTNPQFGHVQKNVDDAVATMATLNADVYVLPELFNTGYNFIDKNEVEQLSEPSDGFTFQQMKKFVKNFSCYIVYGFAEKSNELLYNSASLVGPSGLVGLYRKVHLYYKENVFFTQGNLGFPVFELPFGKVGMMVCFDWMYPESARTLALKGAQLIAHPSNLVLPYCPDAMVTRCLENRVFAATANRVGRENRGSVDLTYIGKSEIVSPKGEILVRLTDHTPGIAIQEIDLEFAKNKQINEYNDLLAGRKPGSYSLS